MRALTLSLILAPVAACSSGAGGGAAAASGSASVDGSVDNRSISPAYAFAVNGPSTTGGTGQTQPRIIVSDDPDLCSYFAAAATGKRANTFYLQFVMGGLSNAPLSARTYTSYSLDGYPDLSAEYVGYDYTCEYSNGVLTTGSVTLTGVGATYTGTFDLTFDTGDHVTGNFTAPLCTDPDTSTGVTCE